MKTFCDYPPLSNLSYLRIGKRNLKNWLLCLMLLTGGMLSAATITSTSTGGTWSSTTTWVGGVVPTTTDTAIIASGATVTLTAARTVINVTINAGGTLNIGSVNALTVTGNFVNNGTFSATTGRLYLTGTTGSFTNAGTFTMGAGRLYLYGNLTAMGTHTLTGTQVRLTGNGTQSIAGFTTTGLFNMQKTGGTATLTGNVSSAGITVNGSGGSVLNLGTGLTHNTTNVVTLSAGTLNGGSSTLNISVISTGAWAGTGAVFVAGTGKVVFNAAGNQTLSATNTTFNNLTFSGSGTKSVTTSRCIVNGILSMEGTSTMSAAPTYGTAASLVYNTATARTAGPEWITPFAATGGVTISNTGAITANAAKVFNASVPLTINSGATLNTNSLQFTFGGNFTNSGTFNAGSSPIVIASTMTTQSISGFTTTGLLSMTKTAGVATLQGNVSCNGMTINGTGGTLNLGSALTHTTSGVVTLTAGTLNASSCTLNVNAISTTAWNGTGTVFSAGTSTVNFGAAGAQTLSASATTFYNLTFSNSGVKTLTTANCTVSGIVSMEGTATVSAAPTYGAAATLRYNTTTARTAGVEWITPFAATGGVNIANTGVITMNAAKVFNASIPLTINSGASLNTGNFQVNFGGNFSNSGTFTAGSSSIVIDNTMATQSIAGFTTTGLVTFGKASGTATLTGNISGSGLTVNATAGTLNLGTALTHNFSGTLTRTAGTLNLGSSTIRIGGSISGTGGTFTAGTGIVDYNGAAQTIVSLPYYGLNLSGSGLKTFVAATTVSNVIAISSGVVVNLGTGLTHTSNGLSFAGTLQVIGSWGGTGSGAANINSVHFTGGTTGKINNNCSIPSITTQPSTPSATCSGSGVQTLTVVASGSGVTYSWRKGGVALTNSSVVSGQGTATLTLTSPTTADAGSYDVVVTGTCSTSVTSSAVTVTVNATPAITTQPSAQSVCQAASGSFVVATSASSPTYQWQYSTNPVTTWTNTNGLTGFTGHTSATLSFTNVALARNNTNFRCVITGTNTCSTNSNVALLTVSSTAAVGTISGNQSLCSGYEPNDDIILSSANGTIQWQRADNAAFTLNVTNIGTNATTLTSAEIGVLTQTKYFRAQVTSGSCAPIYSSVVAVTIDSTTWTSAGGGSWTNGEPTATKAAIISYNYSTTHDLSACTLTVNNNAVVTVNDSDSIVLNGALTVAAGSTFTLNNNANLVQNADTANSGNIVVNRSTAALMRQDYVLWSSPVSGQQLQAFSPNTLSNRFYTYNPVTNNYAAVASPSTTNFADAKGYLIRMPNTHPATPTTWTGTFTGVPHTGPYSVSVTSGTYNAVGNPYPSTIDADAFIIENSLTEALYFWRKTNSATTSSYATYTLAGGVSNSSGDPLGLIPNGTIQVGQGFIAKATSATLDFTNAMRINNSDNQFLRFASDDKSRVWLNLTNDAGYFGQTMVAYMPNATVDVDAAIDGRYINDCQTALTSIINNEEFSIQGRPLPFEATDVVQLGFKCVDAGNFSIALGQTDGMFATDQANIPVYLKDNLTGTIHDLKAGAYSFAAQSGVDNTRFELVYENLLSTQNPTFNEQSVIVYKQNGLWNINSGAVKMKSYQVYDMQGRVILEQDQVLSSEAKFMMSSVQEVLIVKITSMDGAIVTQKIMN